MNLKPEQIPDEVVEAAARAVERQGNPHLTDEEFEIWWSHDPLFCERLTTWVGYTNMTRKEVALCQARTSLAAALPVLLWEPVAFSVRSADGELSKLGFFHMDHFDATKRLAVLREGWHYVFAYHVAETTIPIQDTPNADQ